MNPLDAVTEAVDTLTKALPGLLEGCADPEGADVAELLLIVSAARVKLQGVERDTEASCAKAMLSNQIDRGGLFAERYRATERKAWDHEAWQRDVRAKALQAAGLKGAQGVLSADGEVLDPSVLHDLLARLQSVHGAQAPKTKSLREFGLDPDDYCERSPGSWHVRVQHRVPVEGGVTDAA